MEAMKQRVEYTTLVATGVTASHLDLMSPREVLMVLMVALTAELICDVFSAIGEQRVIGNFAAALDDIVFPWSIILDLNGAVYCQMFQWASYWLVAH